MTRGFRAACLAAVVSAACATVNEADGVLGGSVAADAMGRRVASPLVTLVDFANTALGETCPVPIWVDDEGVEARDAVLIEDGVLRSYMHNKESAAHFGAEPTGNARAYGFYDEPLIRMRNTAILPGESKLQDMIASVKKGWYLSRLNSGMEDPRNWGIQLLAMVGREIVDGVFTGRVASPIICSGYVPDVLGAIDMVSEDFALSGSGFCGKGYKEYVKVSSGGPCIKTKMRLG